jgi:hypothetical protein
MKKFFYVLPAKAAKQYDTYEAAEEAAKKSVGRGNDMFTNGCGGDYYIMETIAVAKQPIPDVEVTKL